MKRVTITLILLCAALCAASAQPDKGAVRGAHLSFVASKHDFGSVSRHGQNLIHEFEFVNDGTEPVVVLSVTTSCSCLKAECSRKPVAPQSRGVVRVVLEPQKVERGVFHRVIQVRSNSTDGVNLLTVQGNAK